MINSMYTIISYLSPYIVSFILLLTLSPHRALLKRKPLKIQLMTLILPLAFTLIYLAPQWLGLYSNVQDIPYPYFFILLFLTGLFFSHQIKASPILPQIIIIFFYITVLQLIKIACGPIYFGAEFPTRKLIDVLLSFLTFFILYAMNTYIKKFPIYFSSHLPKRYWLLLFGSPLSIYLYFTFFNPFVHYEYDASLCALLILVNMVLIYYLFALATYQLKEIKTSEQVTQNLERQILNLKHEEALIDLVGKQKHELKNNYFYIHTLLNQKKYDELDDYLTHSIGDVFESIEDYHTGNQLVDFVINQKFKEAQKQQIKVSLNARLPQELPIQSEDLSALLLNLLNNAIEASEKEVYKQLVLNLKIYKNYLHIQIKNYCSEDILQINPQLKTSKPYSSKHGYGLKIVKSIVKKYHGFFKIDMVNHYFTVSILLELNIQN